MRSKMADAWVNQEDGPHFGDLRMTWRNPRWSGIPNKTEARDYSLLRFLLWGGLLRVSNLQTQNHLAVVMPHES